MTDGGVSPVKFALSNPWVALERALDGPLHPGGEEATEELLERASVSEGDAVLDEGCGAGNSLEVARKRGADPVGLDETPMEGSGALRTVRGRLTRLPFADSSFDVVLSECSICLSSDLAAALSEARRVLVPDGRIALSDVTVDDPSVVSALPDSVVEALCLGKERETEGILSELEEAGFEVTSVRDHGDDLARMRDEILDKVEYRRLLGLMGDRGEEILEGVEALERAIDDGGVGYVSVVGVSVT